MMVLAVFLLSVMLMSGCQERVVRRSGIGADEINPRVSEPEGNDRLSNYVWGDDKKKN